MAPFKWVVEIEVDPMWVEDGFQLTPENVQRRIADRLLPYAFGEEVTARVLRAPSKLRVLKMQGLKKAKEYVCPLCDGRGQVMDTDAPQDARWHLKLCRRCGGKGELHT